MRRHGVIFGLPRQYPGPDRRQEGIIEVNEKARTITARIVYYGPAVGGKTTNLNQLHEHAARERRGMMVSVNSVQERTILFDMLPIKTIGFRSYDFRLQLLGVAGQSMYEPARKAALKGVDGIVFVANSALDRQKENVQAFGEMTRELVTHGVDVSEIPLVLQYNKRDLPEAAPIYAMDRDLNKREVPSFPATAASGEGVLETFGAVLEGVVRKLALQYEHLDLPDGMAAGTWTQAALRGIFGHTTLGSEVAGKASEPSQVVPAKIKAPRPVKPPKPVKLAPPEPRKPKRVQVEPPREAAPRAVPPPKPRPAPPPP